MIVGLFLELLPAGGVQQAGRHAAAALARLAAERGDRCVLLSLRDSAGTHRIAVGDREVRFTGLGASQTRFALRALRAAARARCIYVQHPNLAALVIAFRAIRPRAAVAVVAHGIDVWEPLSPLRRRGLHAATRVVAVSEATAQKVVAVQGVPASRVVVVPNTLDPDLERRARDAPAERAPELLTIARLAASERYKGVDHVIEALPALRREVPNARYVVVGEGDDRPRLEALARERGVEVAFLGRVGRDALDERLRSAAVFVMPSGGEGFGIVYLEAMAYGIPVVAASSGGAPEVVADGETGFLVGYGDVAAIADRTAALLQDERLRRRLGAAARRRARDYTLDAVYPRLVEALECAG